MVVLSGYLNYGKLPNVTPSAGDTAHSIAFDPTEAHSGGAVGNALAVGDWMIVVMSASTTHATAQVPAASTGWVSLVPFAQVGSGTMCFGIWAKQRQAGETTYPWTLNADTGRDGVCYYQTLWVSDADVSSNWMVGTFAARQTNASTTTTLAPAMTTTQADSYVLAISGERTIAPESGPQITVSGAGFSKIIHSAPADLTVTFAANMIPEAGTGVGPVTTTYPNAHSYNGIAGLIAIPGAPVANEGLMAGIAYIQA